MLYSKIEGEGHPFLIIHGFLGMSDNWKTLGGQFAAQGFQVHMLDMRNHGRSFHTHEFTYEAMANDVLEYCQVNHLENIVLLGHSMGGKIAMLLSCLHPDLVSKLIVADIGPKFYAPHHDTILAGLSAVDFSQKPSRNQVDEIVSQYITDFGTRQFLLKSLYWEEPGQLAFRFNLPVFMNNKSSIGKALPEALQFDKSTLFLRGDKSDYILDDDISLIKHHFPVSEIQTISNAGHWLHAENPQDFYYSVLRFIK
jgi:pimeloyl-ACP methyl ester carboxylesterase